MSLLLVILSAFMLACAAASLRFHEGARTLRAFLLPEGDCILTFVLVFSLKPCKERPYFSAKSGYLFVSIAWVAASCVGALPFVISGAAPSFRDAFFEPMSGFTTTGASSSRTWRSCRAPFCSGARPHTGGA